MTSTAQAIAPKEMYSEGARMLRFLRALGTEDQRIAYAVLEGMQLQKKLDTQTAEDKPRPRPSA